MALTDVNLFRIDGTVGSTSNLQTSALNGGPLAGTRNHIINGDMRIAQRGTSFAEIAGGSYSLDRWLWRQAGAMACTVSQSTDVPNNTFQSSYKVDVTTADASIAAGDAASIVQAIEGFNVRDLIDTTFTVSFWVKSPKTGIHCVSFRNSATTDRSYVKEYSVTSANTWEYKTVAVTGGLITAGNWNWTNGAGLVVNFVLAAGTTSQTTADAWQTGNFIATANQVNVMDNTANDFFLTGVQLEPGTVATPFERRHYGQELALCQRYCFVAPGNWIYGFGGVSAGVGNFSSSCAFPSPMRAAPTASGVTFGLANCGSPSPTITANSITYSTTSSASGGASFALTAGTYSIEL